MYKTQPEMKVTSYVLGLAFVSVFATTAREEEGQGKETALAKQICGTLSITQAATNYIQHKG